ncbi:MAG: phosphoglycerate kinase [Hyphomicrobiales bacterium]|nr:MAG: phosphoglycerate kinase [Hyphomicrobiales bacterium]
MDLDKVKTTSDLDVSGKRVFVRADLNVPVRDGKVSDATRLERVAPGLADLARRGAKVIVASHFGRPKGGPSAEHSLRPVADALAGFLGKPVAFATDCIGPEADKVVAALKPGDIAVLENLRFHKGEEGNDAEFGRKLAAHADIYVNDAFSAAHRAHASTVTMAKLLPAYAGPLLMEEIDALRSVLDRPRRPVAAVIGGAKVSTKIPVLTNLLEKVDVLIIGGGMANTFLLAQGVQVGKSLVEADFVGTAKEIMAKAAKRGCKIMLPLDAVVAQRFEAGAPSINVPISEVPADQMILDVGRESVVEYIAELSTCRTVLWNGPLGAFEIAPFGEGTFNVAGAVAELTAVGNMVSVAGGGDTVAALNMARDAEKFTYVSTAGGAFLEWLEGIELPGIKALIPA